MKENLNTIYNDEKICKRTFNFNYDTACLITICKLQVHAVYDTSMTTATLHKILFNICDQ